MRLKQIGISAIVILFIAVVAIYFYAITNNLVVTMADNRYSILCNATYGPSHPGRTSPYLPDGSPVATQVKYERPSNCEKIPKFIGDILLSLNLAESGPVY